MKAPRERRSRGAFQLLLPGSKQDSRDPGGVRRNPLQLPLCRFRIDSESFYPLASSNAATPALVLTPSFASTRSV